jgi:protein arginine N-methyltransferase 1
MARSTIEFGATRIASSEWLMDIAYDVMNKHNFAGLAEHEEMLSDRVRIDTYHRGITRNIRPGDVVLDLGTGTGVLAMMASRAGARKVYAVEHSEFIEVAREIAAHNGFTNIEFVQANSREFTPPEQIDVVLHEQMGDELFNENLLGNVLDLRRRVLRAGGRILPGRFRLFIEPVSLRESMRVRRLWNIDLPDGIDLGCLRSSPVAARFDHGRMEHLWARAGSVEATIGTPTPIMEIDLGTLESVSEIPTEFVVERTAAVDTIVDGACVWFEAVFDDETVLTTSPLAPVTSWGNRLFRLDREVGHGEQVRLLVRMSELDEPATWSVTEARA